MHVKKQNHVLVFAVAEDIYSIMRITTHLLFAACLSALMFPSNNSAFAQGSFEINGLSCNVTMVGSPLMTVSTKFVGTGQSGWLPTKVESLVSSENGVQCVVNFEDIGTMSFSRTQRDDGNEILNSDSWVPESELLGEIFTEISIPFDELGGASFITAGQQVTYSEILSNLSDSSTTFLVAREISEFAIKNELGIHLVLRFSKPGKLDLISYPSMRKVVLRFYWCDNGTIVSGSMDWSLTVSEK